MLKNRVGERRYNKSNLLMEIIEYRHANDISVLFESGYISKTRYSHFKRGGVKDYKEKIIYGRGYLGDDTAFTKKEYTTWVSMFRRCYDPKYHFKKPSYRNCEVHEYFHNFQNFRTWFEENFYELEGDSVCLDKDILRPGNKIYGPDTCLFVPKKINSFFIGINKIKLSAPIGVTFYCGRYYSRCNHEGKLHKLGSFSTQAEAFEIYKNFKEMSLRNLIEPYRDKIPSKVFKILSNYKITNEGGIK